MVKFIGFRSQLINLKLVIPYLASVKLFSHKTEEPHIAVVRTQV
jgi:hypothetical protein